MAQLEEAKTMIRQAINCDICGAEKQATSYWFVAYEQNGEIKLKGWEAPQNSRKHVKHLCGQKCVQRIMANFMAAVMANGHGGEAERESVEADGGAGEVEIALGSWAGPVRAKESLWDVPVKAKVPTAAGRMQKTA